MKSLRKLNINIEHFKILVAIYENCSSSDVMIFAFYSTELHYFVSFREGLQKVLYTTLDSVI